MNRKLNFFIISVFIFFTLGLSTVYALQQSSGTNNIQIKYPEQNEYILGDDVELYFHIYNYTGKALTNTTTPCYVHVYNQTGQHIYQGLNQVPFTPTSYDYEVLIDKSNVSTLGEYSYIFQCQNSEIGGFVTNTFYIVDSYTTTQPDITALVLFLLGLLVVCLTLTFLVENWLKLAFLLGSFILLAYSFNIVASMVAIGGYTIGVINLIWFGYIMSVVILFAMVLYTLWKLTMGLKIEKNPEYGAKIYRDRNKGQGGGF